MEGGWGRRSRMGLDGLLFVLVLAAVARVLGRVVARRREGREGREGWEEGAVRERAARERSLPPALRRLY